MKIQNSEFFNDKFWRKVEAENFSHWRKVEQEFVEKFKAENSETVNNMKIDYLVDNAIKIKMRLDIAKKQWEWDKKNGVGIMERMTHWYLLSDKTLEKKLKRLWIEIKMRLYGYECGNLSPERIEIAREIPISNVYPELPKIINCINPKHADKTPSMSIGLGFAHCFSCGVNYDTIGFVMQKENLKFPEAVNFILDSRENLVKS
jgi:hypothetical protein